MNSDGVRRGGRGERGGGEGRGEGERGEGRGRGERGGGEGKERGERGARGCTEKKGGEREEGKGVEES